MSSLGLHPVDLEPSLVAHRVYATRRRHARIGVPVVLGVMLGLLYLLPAGMIIPNLTLVGRPAMIVALLLWCWWVLARLNPGLAMVGPQPLRWAVLAITVSMLLSYAAGVLRGLPTLEANGANLALIWTLEFIGVVLMAADGPANWANVHGVLRVYVLLAGYMAIFGIVQSLTTYDLSAHLVLPGLKLKGDLAGFGERGAGLFRVAGTATHYIEFSALMAMAVPFAIHLARFARTRHQRQIFSLLTLLIVASIPMALSRTGVLAILIAIVIMIPVWSWRVRFNMLVIGIAGVAVFMAVRPGVLGTLKSLFTSANTDPSIQGRQEDYADVLHYFIERPWLGRGPGTFIPILYRILDNQWLGTLVTNGIVGVAAFAGLHITCIALGAMALRQSTSVQDRHLCAALISTQVIAIFVGGTFDSLGFSTYAFTLAFLTGLTGAVWRLTHPAQPVRTSTIRSYGQ